MHKIGQSGGFLGRLLRSLLKAGLTLIGNVPKPLSKSVLTALAVSASAPDVKENFCIRYENIDNSEWENERYHENN